MLTGRSIEVALVVGASLYNRNDLTAPGLEIVTKRMTVRTWGSVAECRRHAEVSAAAAIERGDPLQSIWINPGPDYRLGPIIFGPEART